MAIYNIRQLAKGDDVPSGYRQGIITAITVFLGFSLAFLRFWGFETEGKWTAPSVASAFIVFISVLLQLYALYRALDLKDENTNEYIKTVRFFFAGVTSLVVGVFLSMVVFAISPS